MVDINRYANINGHYGNLIFDALEAGQSVEGEHDDRELIRGLYYEAFN